VSGEEVGAPPLAAKPTNGAPISQRVATITSLALAFEVVKAMQADGLVWGEGMAPWAASVEEIIEG